jgi:hypothetical protein
MDSDVVNAYERWEYYDQNIKRQPPGSLAINYAANKTKQVGEIPGCAPLNSTYIL